MPTTKLTSLVCVMLTAAMLWSSLGVGLISTPQEDSSDVIVYDDAVSDTNIIPDVPASNTEKPVTNKINANGGSNTITSDGGWNSEPSVAPWGNWSFRDAHNVPETGLTGEGVRVAVADTGIDFGAQNLAGKYMVDNSTLTVTNVSLVAASVSGQDNVSLPNTDIISGSLEIKVNGTVTTGYTPDLLKGEIEFTSALPLGSSVVASYLHQPYAGWPVAFDALGLPQYLLAKEARTGGGGVANTTLNGTGPFDIDHVINVDGKNDFTITESAAPNDRYGDVKTTGTATGLEFDMTELWGTRDPQFWYAGIQTRYGAMNRTFGFALDFDGAVSGSINDPAGNLLDFEASHSAPIEQLAFDANHGLLASCAAGSYGDALTGDSVYNSVKIWDINGNLIKTLPSEQYRVDSVTWSPNGEKLAYATGLETVVYNTSNWTEQWRVPHSAAAKTSYFREALAFSPNGTVLITGALEAANKIFVLNVLTGSTNSPTCALQKSGSVAYNPNGTLIALGLADGRVQIINSTTYATVMVLESFIIFPLVSDGKPIETVTWSPNGTYLATGRLGGGYINIWSLATNLTWGDNIFNLTGHADSQTVNSIIWTSTSIISGCDDGTIIYWNPTTFALVTIRNSRGNSPVLSLALSTANDIFVGTMDCTVRKYPPTWASYTAFAAHKPDLMVYIRYNKENYSEDGKKLLDFDYIEEPEVYKWNTATSSWSKTNMTNIFGKYFYKGSLGGEWTQQGFLEIAIPRNFTAWPNQNTMYINSFVCGDNSSRPQDTVPADCNVPSPTISTYVNWTGTRKVTLSAWGKVYIPKTTINAADIPSVTGKYHYGYHPSAALTTMFGLVPIVVTESATEGVWDRVYVDMNKDYIIDSKDPWVDRDHPVLTYDVWNYSYNSSALPPTWETKPGKDGVPDLSGGMVYFIGDGKTMMPYSERMSEVLVLSGDQRTPFGSDNPMPIPKNGEVVAFFGEFDTDENGKMRTHGTQTASAIAGEGLNKGEFGLVEGVSPDVEFLPICNAQYSLKYALYFAVEGYDGKTNTGDEAQIVSIGQYFTGYGNGLDETTYLVEFLVNSTQSNVVFVSPAGNDGSGYGTIAAPCGMNTLVVGFAEDNTFISGGGDIQHYGAVSELSSRGPTAAGIAKPDVIAIGLGQVDLPLGSSGSLAGSIGGKSQTTVWKGSDLAAAVTAGVMALIFQAYKQATGTYPSTQVAMDIIRSSAKDLGYDTLTQGSGFVDALAAVRMAKGIGGLIVSAPQTSFGNTFGSEYGSFINVLGPGETGTIPVNVQNPTASTQNPVYDIEYMQRINISEKYVLVDITKGYKGDITIMFPANAEVIKVTAQTNYSFFVAGEYKTFISKEGNFCLKLWDWVDAPPGDSLHDNIDVSEISYLAGTEYMKVNALTCTVSNLQNELAGKLVVDITPDSSNKLPTGNWKITVESFATLPWSWSSLSKPTSTITAKSYDNVSIQVDVPTNAQSGTYEAAFVSSYGPTPVNWVNNIQPTLIDEEEYLNTTLYTTYWDDGAKGNYWNDWTAPDANTDGIVDNPYNFLTTGKADLYPLVNPANTYSNARVPATPIAISSNTDFATYAARGDGTAGNPWVIENLDINGSAYSISCISITDTTDYFIIQGCYLHEAQAGTSGVYLTNVENGVFENNNISMNTYDGVFVDSGCSKILINNNTMYMNGNTGMDVVASEHISINCNTISYNQGTIGIYMSGNNITVTGNTIHNNSFGVGSYGIIVESAAYSYILGNKFSSDDIGFYASGMENSEIAYNEFDICPSGSIYLDSSFAACQNNVIHHNDILDLTTNAWDDGTNVWDNGTDGNYWDGAVGTPYAIAGGAGNQDNFPLTVSAYKHMTYRTQHAPISIIGDTDFTLANGVVNPTAAGTLADPFIISDLEINTTGFAHGILVQNTTAHFVIMNCLVYGNVTGYGIELSNAPNGVVRSNELHTLGTGIRILGTSIFGISYNDLGGLTTGVYILNSDNGTVSYNIANTNVNGIYIELSQAVWLHNNSLNGNTNNGIFLGHSEMCKITNNTVDSNGYGIHLANATGFNSIYHNNLISNAVQAYDDFIGDTLTSFEMFSSFGTPANYYSVYDVKQYTITINGIPIATTFTVNNNTGLVTFIVPICGKSGGSIVSIKAILTYEENAPSRIILPNQRITPTTNIKIVVTKLDGSIYVVPAGNYTLHRKVGIIEFTTPFKIEKGIAIFANYTFYNRTGIIPLTLNVLAAETAAIKYGNMSANENALGIGIMPVWGVRAGQGTSLESGDRRYFYVRIPNQGMFSITELANFYLYSELMWGLSQTDINIVIYGKGATAAYPKAAPYIMTKLGGSEEKADFSPLTATGGPKDILVTPFNHEILTICISAKSFNGAGNAITKFNGTSGWIKLSDNNPKARTNNMVGQASVSFQSSVNLPTGISASVVGPAQGTKTVEEIYQDDLTLYDLSTMEGWLTMNAVAGFTKVVTVKNALSWDVHIIGHPECVDLDLAIFYDGKDGQPKDGIAQWREIITNKDWTFDAYGSAYGTGTYAYSADADADEAIKFINPKDGDYIIKVLGFTVTSEPGKFDLEVKSIFAGVEGYKLTSQDEKQYEDMDPLNGNYLNIMRVDGYDVRTFNVLWTFPEETQDGVYGGILMFGIPESQKLITISMDIILDREAPTVSPTFTGPNSVVSSKTPTISAKIEDPSRGEIDPVGTRVSFDGLDVTDLAAISVTETSNSALQLGYWTGDVIYKPLSPLSEGGHFISIESKDLTGNVATRSWGFTVDTTKPMMTLSNSLDEIYTSVSNYQLSGITESSSTVSFIGVQGTVNQRIDNSFVLDLELEEGANLVAIRSTDLAGNTYETLKTITLDTVAPEFKRVVALDGSTTNKRMTGIYGEMTEAGTLELNGMQVPVNSDGTFRYDSIMLVEGQNRQILKFTDRAGNLEYSYMNITLDSIAPTLLLSDIDKTVSSEWLNITGKTEGSVASLTINGKLVDVAANGNFQNNIRLSPGINTIVIESKDRAGNSAQEVMTVVYAAEAGTNYGAIGLMVALLIVGLILGLFLAPIILGGKKEEMPAESDAPTEENATEVDASPESEELETAPEEVAPESIDEAVPETEELEPITAEEAKPVELPEEVPPIEAPAPQSAPAAEDPRIAKLKEAYESGKISKDLYEKNLARFKGE
jgi:parallel beta-helix repeat protein